MSGRVVAASRALSSLGDFSLPRARMAAAVLAFMALAPRPAHAQAPASELANAAAAACGSESSALGRAACSVVESLGARTDALVVAVEVALPAGDGHEHVPKSLLQRLAQLVASRLGRAARANPEPASLSDAQRQAHAAEGLLYLSVALYRDRLQVSADLYLGAGHFWQRMRSPGLRLAQHGFATVPLDAELRALFPVIPLVVTRVDKARASERDIVGLVCGDVRGDGSSELVAISRRSVQVGRLEHGQFAPRASVNWADFTGIAPNPLREPIATGSVPMPGRLWVGLSDRADALDISSALSGALRVERTWHGILPWPGGGCTRRAGLAYEGLARACPDTRPEPAVDFATPVDAFASCTWQSGEQARTVRVARAPGHDRARVLDSLHPEVDVPDVGAQLAVGDLDDDGLPEIVSTSPSLNRADDQLVVRTLLDNGQLRERFRLAVPSGIDALALCPGQGRAMAPLALATGDGLWIIR